MKRRCTQIMVHKAHTTLALSPTLACICSIPITVETVFTAYLKRQLKQSVLAPFSRNIPSQLNICFTVYFGGVVIKQFALVYYVM